MRKILGLTVILLGFFVASCAGYSEREQRLYDLCMQVKNADTVRKVAAQVYTANLEGYSKKELCDSVVQESRKRYQAMKDEGKSQAYIDNDMDKLIEQVRRFVNSAQNT